MSHDSAYKLKVHESIRKSKIFQIIVCLVLQASCSPAFSTQVRAPTSSPTPIPSAPAKTTRAVALPTLLPTPPAHPDATPSPTMIPTPRTDCKERYSSLPTERDYWPTSEWRVSTLAEHCMDPAKVEHGVWYFEQGNFSGSLLIIRHGELVYEK